jgi:hypothetical protein
MTKVAFIIHIHRDEDYARSLVSELRDHYPISDILAIADGRVQDEELPLFLRQNRVDFVEGDRLKLMAMGGRWVERWLQLALTYTEAERFILLDADTQITKAFNQIPQADWFGCTIPDPSFYRTPVCLGGCMGVSRAYAERILASKLLQCIWWQHPPYGYQRYGKFRFEGEAASDEMILCSDRVMADLAYRLATKLTPWSDICLTFRAPLPDDLTPYAAIHPRATRIPPTRNQ